MDKLKATICPKCGSKGLAPVDSEELCFCGGKKINIPDSEIAKIVSYMEISPLISSEDASIIYHAANSTEVIDAMIELKKNNIIDYGLKMAQFRAQYQQLTKTNAFNQANLNIYGSKSISTTNAKSGSGMIKGLKTKLNLLKSKLNVKKAAVTIIPFFLIFFIVISIYNRMKPNIADPINKFAKGIESQDLELSLDAFHNYGRHFVENRIIIDKYNNYLEELKNVFGDNYKITIKVVFDADITANHLEYYERQAKSINSDLIDGTYFDIEELHNVNANVTFSGNGNKVTQNHEFLVAKIQGKYYLLHYQKNIFVTQFYRFYGDVE